MSENAKCSIWSVAFNIINTTVGAGIIGLPFALREAGFFFGIFLACFVCFLTNLSLILMIWGGERVKEYTFGGFVQYAWGKSGWWVVNGVVVINGLGTMISYMIIVGSTVPIIALEYFPEVSLLHNRILPLLFYRSIGRLSKISLLGVLCVPVIIFSVVYRTILPAEDQPKPPAEFPVFGQHVFPAIGVMAFAFVSHHNAFLNYVSLKKQTVGQWMRASSFALFTSLVVSLTLAVAGYVAFGEDVTDNILDAFPKDDHVINFARFILAFSMFLTYPMQFYPTRNALLRMSMSKYRHSVAAELEVSKWVHLLLTFILFIGTLLPSLFLTDLGIVYELVGGFCSTMIAFLLPASSVFYILYKTSKNLWYSFAASSTTSLLDRNKKRNDQDSNEEATLLIDYEAEEQADLDISLWSSRWTVFGQICCVFIFGFGLLAMVAGTGLTLRKVITGTYF